jgi:peptidoglycan/xylan/chitin deacetylase (PgdA/CDA1 family)
MILSYHEVMSLTVSAYAISCERMSEHLVVIACGAQVGTAGSLRVTFDDGVDSQFQNGLPLLQKYGVKACFFVNVGFIGECRTIKGWKQQFMSWSELQELIRLGHSVQSHGWSHEFLTSCSEHELDNQLQRSRLTLEQRLGTTVDSISVPGGRWNRKVWPPVDEQATRMYWCLTPGFLRQSVKE